MNSRFTRSISSSRCDGKSETEMNKGGQEGSQYPFVSILSMTGGYGHSSYSTNSLLQAGVMVRFIPAIKKLLLPF
ncbi:uncharacterized protein LOC125592338 isoform X2 [Brassica napus]|uniref:uncharacterized protein LOC125592338 isoform X2 n=1 Tax=Brassica napus TaxID=3708 RepID=UPI00207A8024|nr:uncharacterized protein LOC125592338 isoform X2 [Brassica napus]